MYITQGAKPQPEVAYQDVVMKAVTVLKDNRIVPTNIKTSNLTIIIIGSKLI